MCGFVGFVGEKDEAPLLEKLNEVQIHRGPDDKGTYFCKRNRLHLAVRRLSIIDLEGGHQPMSTADENYWIVFNGEIFNAPELRKELEGNGIRFGTDHSDTEVLLHLYVRYGQAMVPMLNGMFGFVIYDRKEAKLFGARDPFGIKPLHYSTAGGRFSFASEIKSLKLLPWVSEELDYQAVFHFFSFQSVPAPLSILKDVSKLPAAHWLEWNIRRRELKTGRYWRPQFGTSLPVPEADLTGYVLDELREAVKRWSLSDVPVACSLSGGLDSSSITALLSEHSDNTVSTFSLGFKDAPELDERKLARQVAARYGTQHNEIVIHSNDLMNELENMLYHLDEPYAGGLPSWFVFRGMGRHVKVGMSGTGGDEIFGNYGKWKVYRKSLSRIRYAKKQLDSGRSFLDGYREFTNGHIYHPTIFPDSFKQHDLFNFPLVDHIEHSSTFINRLWNSDLPSEDAIADVDFQQQLPNEFLHMTDRFSMAHSLEMRTPFLDRIFVEKMLAIPSSTRTDHRDVKHLLRASVKQLLPQQVCAAPKKGFILPMKDWMRGALRETLEELTAPAFLKEQNLFKEDLHRRLIQPYLDSTRENTEQIWTLLLFQKWWTRFCQ